MNKFSFGSQLLSIYINRALQIIQFPGTAKYINNQYTYVTVQGYLSTVQLYRLVIKESSCKLAFHQPFS